jgi:hypothetical protein
MHLSLAVAGDERAELFGLFLLRRRHVGWTMAPPEVRLKEHPRRTRTRHRIAAFRLERGGKRTLLRKLRGEVFCPSVADRKRVGMQRRHVRRAFVDSHVGQQLQIVRMGEAERLLRRRQLANADARMAFQHAAELRVQTRRACVDRPRLRSVSLDVAQMQVEQRRVVVAQHVHHDDREVHAGDACARTE